MHFDPDNQGGGPYSAPADRDLQPAYQMCLSFSDQFPRVQMYNGALTNFEQDALDFWWTHSGDFVTARTRQNDLGVLSDALRDQIIHIGHSHARIFDRADRRIQVTDQRVLRHHEFDAFDIELLCDRPRELALIDKFVDADILEIEDARIGADHRIDLVRTSRDCRTVDAAR